MSNKDKIHYLHKNGWSYKKISKLMNISTSTLYNYRKNKVKNPRKINYWFKSTYQRGKKYVSYTKPKKVTYRPLDYKRKSGFNFRRNRFIRESIDVRLTTNNYLDFRLKVYNKVTQKEEDRYYRYGMKNRYNTNLHNEIDFIIKKLIDDYESYSYIELISIQFREKFDYKEGNGRQFKKQIKRIKDLNV